MRILLSIHQHASYDAGGAGVTLRLADEYRRVGHLASVLSFDDLPSWLHEKAAQVVYPWFVASHVACRPVAVDILDASTGDAWLLAAMRRRRTPLVVVRSHGLEHIAHLEQVEQARRGDLNLSWRYPLYNGGWRLREVAWSVRHADLALFLNARDRDFAVNNLGVARDRAAIVDNGVPDTFLGLPLLQRDGPGNVAMIGSFIAGKGVQYAVPSLTRLLERHPELRAGFFGVGIPSTDVLEQFPPVLRLRIEVVERYANDALPALLRDYSIQVMPSLADGFGLAALEGMACGLAVIVTTVSGIADRLTDGEDALIIEPGNAEAIEDAVERLLADPDLLTRIRRGAHATAQRFSWARISGETLALYEGALERKRAQRGSP